MNSDQRNKTKLYVNKLLPVVRQRLFSNAAQAYNQTGSHASTQATITNKHDRARLIHLYFLPAAQPYWATIKNPLNRTQLDSPFNEVNQAYNMLAQLFNDYENIIFQNETISYENGIKISPYKPRYDAMKTLADKCYELDPQSLGRPNRDGAWIKKEFSTMKTAITKVKQPL
jgi:hypothetical protein